MKQASWSKYIDLNIKYIHVFYINCPKDNVDELISHRSGPFASLYFQFFIYERILTVESVIHWWDSLANAKTDYWRETPREEVCEPQIHTPHSLPPYMIPPKEIGQLKSLIDKSAQWKCELKQPTNYNVYPRQLVDSPLRIKIYFHVVCFFKWVLSLGWISMKRILFQDKRYKVQWNWWFDS